MTAGYFVIEDPLPRTNLHRVIMFDCLDKALDFFCASSNRDALDVWPMNEEGVEILDDTPHVLIGTN